MQPTISLAKWHVVEFHVELRRWALRRPNSAAAPGWLLASYRWRAVTFARWSVAAVSSAPRAPTAPGLSLSGIAGRGFSLSRWRPRRPLRWGCRGAAQRVLEEGRSCAPSQPAPEWYRGRE